MNSPSTSQSTAQTSRRSTRAPIVVVAALSLIASIGARQLTGSIRASGAAISGAGANVSISGFDSYALALLLGGLRGPLVMILWPNSESQKSERNLADFDTQVEWIRLLQPEFDSVHIFQIWNKAYNISVQMASVRNKYTTILDAIDYGMSVDAERPNNINIISAIGGIWFDKLGNSNEKASYRAWVRAESLPHGSRSKVKKGAPGWTRLDMDPILDEKGYILPNLVTPKLAPPPSPVTPMLDEPEYNDGSQLQFLKKFEPFPDGVSPLALGYNYNKRAQVIQATGKQRHLQLSDLVIDSRPALALKTWAEEEWELGRRNEAVALGLPAVPANAERLPLELMTANVTVTRNVAKSKAVEDALFNYKRAAQVGHAALDEYARHIKKYTQNITTYRAHQDHVRAFVAMVEADHDLLKALTLTDQTERKALLTSALANYKKASDLAALNALRYYTDDAALEAVLRPGITKYTITDRDVPPGQLTQQALAANQFIEQRGQDYEGSSEDRLEYITYIQRCLARIRAIDPSVVR